MYDKQNLNRLETLNASAPEGMDAFWAFDQAAFKAGTIDGKTKQLIALGVALTTQCPYCIDLHTQAARDAGANDEELAEAAVVAAAIRAGGAITHATHMFDK